MFELTNYSNSIIHDLEDLEPEQRVAVLQRVEQAICFTCGEEKDDGLCQSCE